MNFYAKNMRFERVKINEIFEFSCQKWNLKYLDFRFLNFRAKNMQFNWVKSMQYLNFRAKNRI